MPSYQGSCHCGAVRFRFEDATITAGVRCNCSLCIRRGAVMSARYYPREALEIDGVDALAVYVWGDRMMNHYFCRTCGAFPFSDVIEDGRYRINLGCVTDVDPLALDVTVIDGRSF